MNKVNRQIILILFGVFIAFLMILILPSSCSVKESDVLGIYRPNYLYEGQIKSLKRHFNIDISGTEEVFEVRADGTFRHTFKSPKLGAFDYVGEWKIFSHHDNMSLKPYYYFNPHENSFDKMSGYALVVSKELFWTSLIINDDLGLRFEKR